MTADDTTTSTPGCGTTTDARKRLAEKADAEPLELGAYGNAMRTISDMRTAHAKDSQEHARKARALARAEAEVARLRMVYDASQAALSECLTEHRELREGIDALTAEWLSEGVMEDGIYPIGIGQAEDMCAHALRNLLDGGAL